MTNNEKTQLKVILFRMSDAIPFEYNTIRSAVQRDINILCETEQEKCEKLIRLCLKETTK